MFCGSLGPHRQWLARGCPCCSTTRCACRRPISAGPLRIFDLQLALTRSRKPCARMRARLTSAFFFDPQHGPNTNVALRAYNHEARAVQSRRHRNCSDNDQPDEDSSGHEVQIRALEALSACCHDCRYGQKAPGDNKCDKGFQCQHQRPWHNSPLPGLFFSR